MNRNGSFMRTTTAALLLVSLSTVDGSERSSQAGAMSQPIQQIDHIMIRTGDPRELSAFFAETLQLPVAWPMTSPRAGVMTGGIGFGNVNVEAIQFPAQTDSRPMGPVMVELLHEGIEPGLLLQHVGGGRFGRLALQRQMHAFVPTVLLRVAGPNAFDLDAEPQPPHGEPAEAVQRVA